MQIPKQIPALTGIRGVAALWVVSLHYTPPFETLVPQWKSLDFIWRNGGAGVPLFFLLSGFILAHVYHAREFKLSSGSFMTFMKHRLFRLYPVHVFALLALVALVVAAQLLKLKMSGDYGWVSLLLNLLLMQNFPFVHCDPWNYPSWSVSVEWFSYIFIFPAGCLLVQRRLFRSAYLNLAGVVACVVVALLFRFCRWFSNADLIFLGAFLFLGGMLLYSYVRTAGRLFAGFGYAGTCGLLACVVVFYFSSYTSAVSFFLLMTPLFILESLLPESFLARLLSLGPVVYLGDISYSLYMTHGVVIKFLKILLLPSRFADHGFFIRLGVFSAYVLSIAGAALLCYYLVEKPSRTFLRKRFG